MKEHRSVRSRGLYAGPAARTVQILGDAGPTPGEGMASDASHAFMLKMKQEAQQGGYKPGQAAQL